MFAWRLSLSLTAVMSTILPAEMLAREAEKRASEKIEIIRDRWGVPHIFASTDRGAMYGLGYAMAEDRAFQMYYYLRIMQGRLSELVGDRRKRNGKQGSVQNDKKMRSFGWWRHAKMLAKRLDPDSFTLLVAFSSGVNARMKGSAKDRHRLFQVLGLDPEPWTPAACLVSWWHLAQFFATDGTRDFIAWRNTERPRPGRPTAPRIPPDDSTAVVKRGDVSDAWVRKVDAFLARNGLDKLDSRAEKGKKFSHAWVVGGKRNTSGSAVLVSDPQTRVSNPNLFVEFHLSGKTFNARGIGVAGSPVILIGFNEHVAWGATALGADQADLFRLETDQRKPNQYKIDGIWKKMRVRNEPIRIQGKPTQEYIVRETELGTVMTEFCFLRKGEGEVTLKRVPLCDNDVETVQGSLAMLRSKNVLEFRRALHDWRFPSANFVFGDRAGDIGYGAVGALPIRSAAALKGGRLAHDGKTSKNDWRGFVPAALLPQVINPRQGWLMSANHRPIEAFYRIYTGASTGSQGDTLRSWRLRERLQAKEMFTPKDVLAIHYDMVNPARREIVRAGLYLRDKSKARLSEDARAALELLDPWFAAGAQSDLRKQGTALAMRINIMFRRSNTELAAVHGGGLSGLSRFLKTLAHRIENGNAEFSSLERGYVDDTLANAYLAARARYGWDSAKWETRAREDVSMTWLPFQAGLDGFPGLDVVEDQSLPKLYCIDGGTIHSQRGQSYTQWVPMHDVDQALSILPFGQSEDSQSHYRQSTLHLWEKGELHPAPLTRKAVEKIAASRRVLEVRY